MNRHIHTSDLMLYMNTNYSPITANNTRYSRCCFGEIGNTAVKNFEFIMTRGNTGNIYINSVGDINYDKPINLEKQVIVIYQEKKDDLTVDFLYIFPYITSRLQEFVETDKHDFPVFFIAPLLRNEEDSYTFANHYFEMVKSIYVQQIANQQKRGKNPWRY